MEKYKKNQKNELKYCLLSTNLVYHTKNDLSIFFLKKYKKISYFFPLDCFSQDCFSQIIIFFLRLFFSFFHRLFMFFSMGYFCEALLSISCFFSFFTYKVFFILYGWDKLFKTVGTNYSKEKNPRGSLYLPSSVS